MTEIMQRFSFFRCQPYQISIHLFPRYTKSKMKNMFVPAIWVMGLVTAFSCSKSSMETGSLTGNWNVVNDSSVNTNKFYTLPEGVSGIISSNYIGAQCGANFNFYPNGSILTSFLNCSFAFSAVDSGSYVQAGNKVSISIVAQNAGCCSFAYLNPVITRTYLISNLTKNTATLTFQSVYPSSSGGVSGLEIEMINLKK